jgi:hypothetical protein
VFKSFVPDFVLSTFPEALDRNIHLKVAVNDMKTDDFKDFTRGSVLIEEEGVWKVEKSWGFPENMDI